MRESEQTQRIKSQGDLIPERKSLASMSSATNSNIPLMAMTPISSSNTPNTSNHLYKDLTSSLFDPMSSSSMHSHSHSSMSTSQTMPSLLRPSVPMAQPQAPMRPTMNFSATSNRTDLTSSLLNNVNSLASRSQASPTGVPMNAMNPAMPSPYFNAGPSTGGALFQPPPAAGSMVMKGPGGSSNTAARPKTAASELDDLFN